MAAKIIAIEGSDGVGKATQAEMLVRHLKEEGFKIASMSFPRYDTELGKEIKKHLMNKTELSKDPLQMSKLYHEDRKSALPLIKRMIQENDFIIFDRYKYSSMAHQASKADPDKREEIIKQIAEMEKDIPEADIVIVLMIPSEMSQKMLEKEKIKDMYESSIEYQNNTNQIYKELSSQNNWIEIECVENRNLLSIDEIHNKIYLAVKEFLK